MSTKLYDKFISQLELKGYAKRSIQSYLRAVRQLQNYCCKALEDIRPGQRVHVHNCRSERFGFHREQYGLKA